MELYIMRHADAVDGTGNDFTRCLSDKGKKQAEKMGAWLERLVLETPRILSSPYPRAFETATLVASCLRSGHTVQPDERLASGMTVDQGSALIHEIGRATSAVLLVGHAPDLGLFVSHLLGSREMAIELRKGAIACLEARRSGFGGSILKWFITPSIEGTTRRPV